MSEGYSLKQIVDQLEEGHKAKLQFDEMRQAMQTFVDRVERGEVRSKKTYAQFKDILQRTSI